MSLEYFLPQPQNYLQLFARTINFFLPRWINFITTQEVKHNPKKKKKQLLPSSMVSTPGRTFARLSGPNISVNELYWWTSCIFIMLRRAESSGNKEVQINWKNRIDTWTSNITHLLKRKYKLIKCYILHFKQKLIKSD